MMFLLFCLLVDQGPKPEVVYLQPFDVIDENDPNTFFGIVRQLEIDNDQLYLRPHGSEILVFNRDRSFSHAIGRKGHGPGEFPDVVYAFGVNNGDVLAISSQEDVLHFQDQDYAGAFKIKGANLNIYGISSNTLSVSHGQAMISANPRTRKIGALYSFDGKSREGVGDIFPINQDVLMKNPAYNDNLWVRGGDYWFCIFKYHPLIQKFNEQLEKVDEFTYSDQLVNLYQEKWEDFESKQSFRFPPAMNTDLKYHDGHLYVICYGSLLQINAVTGEHARTWHFKGQGKGFEHVEGGRLHLPHISFFSDGQPVISARSDQWGHHLYTAQLNLRKRKTP